MTRRLDDILNDAVVGRRISPEDALAALKTGEIAKLGAAADAVCRRLHPTSARTYNIDRNINYTNICVAGCKFCAFSRTQDAPDAYVLAFEDLERKIDETLALGGDQILLQGGMHPDLPLEWYEDLLRWIKGRYPALNVHGFSPTEIDHMARISGRPLEEVVKWLRDAGLGSLPGGGAEILADRVRQVVSPNKIGADRWIEVCRAWHAIGGRGSATMMFGHKERLEERIEHLDRIRRLQDETGGFTAFICWTFQPANTRMASQPKAGAWEYLKMLAVSRLFLDNVPNLQASWVTQGIRVGQLALRFGANDMGSLMIEENVVAAAGTSFKTSEDEIRETIRQVGYAPRRRDVFYRLYAS